MTPLTIEECIKLHQKDLKMVQKVAILAVIFAFLAGMFIGVIIK